MLIKSIQRADCTSVQTDVGAATSPRRSRITVIPLSLDTDHTPELILNESSLLAFFQEDT